MSCDYCWPSDSFPSIYCDLCSGSASRLNNYSRMAPRPSMITGCLGSGGHQQAKWSPFSPFMLISSVINGNKRCLRISNSTLRRSCWDLKAKQVTNRKKIMVKYFLWFANLLIFGICDILLAHLKNEQTKKTIKIFSIDTKLCRNRTAACGVLSETLKSLAKCRAKPLLKR